MYRLKDERNRRILVIDDNPAIHEDFRKILVNDRDSMGLSEAAGAFRGLPIQWEDPESVGQLGAGVTHEINTLMQCIGGNPDYLAKNVWKLRPVMDEVPMMFGSCDCEERNLATVLFVDDDSKLLRGLKRSLETDFRILTAVSPAEANRLLSTESIDIIVLDNSITGGLGTDFVRQISELYPHIKLLMLSGYVAEFATQRAVSESGVVRILTQPCRATDIADASRETLANSSASDSFLRSNRSHR
ncbi:Response regulator receiver domain-containing protein [Neorhodopirellula lusitana]|uniref:Response regulator receiver domain-containing protein n=1 Tax=Neorhodopirellula lusitana TaxID=445327 RepID=A0ABY1PPJ4_9BACT|nr:response regulator [Neorhodopirellula lusitana]SMP40931.1 Response regulator receiver domain-containing protein [Neorhodopirellula lusitana]